jgi:hypothetical protein
MLWATNCDILWSNSAEQEGTVLKRGVFWGSLLILVGTVIALAAPAFACGLTTGGGFC